MARIVVVTSGKGGVGKTTTTSNIGMTLARLNQKTLLLDADVGLRNLDLLLGLENRIVYTGVDVVKEKCLLQQALITDKRQPKLAFLPLSSNQLKTKITKDQLKELIQKVQDKFDFILIDSPAGIDEGFQTSIEPATEALVVVTPEVPSIRDADRVIGLLMAKGIKDIQLVINRIRVNMIKAEDMMSIDDVTEILGIPLLGVVPDSEKVIISSNCGEPIVLEQTSLPAMAFENMTRRFLGENQEILNLAAESSENIIKKTVRRILKLSQKKEKGSGKDKKLPK